jgi:GNAT superfamily N-acetyltransferase
LILWPGDDDRRTVGGVVGGTYWRWLLTDFLWIDEGIRGLGRRLLMAAEREAIRRGCRCACLETFSFRAPAFYEKLGYLVFGTLDDCAPGHRRYSLKKQFQPGPVDLATAAE